MVFQRTGTPEEGQIAKHAATHLPNGSDPLAEVTTQDITDGMVIVYVNGQPIVQDIQTVINNYTTALGVGTVYIPFGSEAVTGQPYAP